MVLSLAAALSWTTHECCSVGASVVAEAAFALDPEADGHEHDEHGANL